MNYRKKRIISLVWIAAMVMFIFTGYGTVAQKAVADDSLRINVGFYGGPYYEISNYSYSDMCSMSNGTVWTYSGTDTGNFMRVCYAWGVKLSDLVTNSGVDQDSVNFFHMGTSDGYNETYSTFSANGLFMDRYFYPNMVNLVDVDGNDEQQIDYSKVNSDITAGATRVPTILAIGATEFSRAEAVRIARNGEYPDKSPEDLPEQFRYRLLFGQAGLGSLDAAQNVRTSDKNIHEINLQLAGAPAIKVNKKLKSGKSNKIGSKYEVTVGAELPGNYSYISEDIVKKLEEQVLQGLQASYDNSVIKLHKKSNGRYEMEIIGEGNTELTFSYSRSEFDGTATSSSGQTSVTGEKGQSGKPEQDPEKESEKKPEKEQKPAKEKEPSKEDKNAPEKSSVKPDNNNSPQGSSGNLSGGSSSQESNPVGIKKSDSSNNPAKKKSGKWSSVDMLSSDNSGIQSSGKKGMGFGPLAGGAAVIFLAGAAGTTIRFIRSIRK